MFYSYLVPPGGYAPNGNLLNVTDSVTGSWSYSYDNLNRLTGAAAVSSGMPMAQDYYAMAQSGWSYDAFGNRLAESVSGRPLHAMPSASASSYTAASNQMTAYNGSPLAYDAAGDVIVDALNSYLYDAEGRLCAVKTAGPSYTGYIYDAAGTRVAKGSLTTFSCNFSTNGFAANTSWVLGPGGEQVTEYSVTGAPGSYTSTWQHTNAFSGGKIEATYHDTRTYFYLADWLGTKRAEVGSDGCMATFASLPFGNGLSTSAPAGFNACPDATEQHFTGKERDAESGNDYFEARYYSSAMGRFMSPDWSAKAQPVPYAKMDDPQSLNLYAYVQNNPLFRTDPSGHYECKGNTSNCSVVSNGLAVAQAARSQLPAGSPEGAALDKVFSTMGKEGDKNNVVVQFGDLKGYAVSETGTKNGVITITFDMNAMKKEANAQQDPGAELSATVVHEGAIAADVKTIGHDQTTVPEVYSAEQQASRAEAGVYRGLNEESPRGVWEPSWVGLPEGQIQSNESERINGAAAYATATWCHAGGGDCQ